MPVDPKELADQIVEIVRSRAGDFVDAHDDAKAFLLDRSKRLAKLMVRLAQANEDDRLSIRRDITIVQQAAENELATIAVHAGIESRKTFQAVLGTVFEFAKKAVPLVLAAL